MIKYLVIRFSSIGDIVLTTPILRCLKKQVKDSEIHYLTKEKVNSENKCKELYYIKTIEAMKRLTLQSHVI